jgi:hypothetical protein
MHKMGALCGCRKPATRRLRRWQVKDFENWLIFYQARVTAWRSFTSHGARYIESVLDG